MQVELICLPQDLRYGQQPVGTGEIQQRSKEPSPAPPYPGHPATPTSGPPGLPVLHFITLHTPLWGNRGQEEERRGPVQTAVLHSFPQMLLNFKLTASIHTKAHHGETKGSTENYEGQSPVRLPGTLRSLPSPTIPNCLQWVPGERIYLVRLAGTIFSHRV